MSFNRRGPDRRPHRPDRPDRDRFERPQRGPGGDWQPRDAREQRDQRSDRPAGRSYPPRDRPYTPRPHFDRSAQDEGGMSIRLDPRRLQALKQMAAERDTRPGELVREWVEERIDRARVGGGAPASATVTDTAGSDLIERLDDLARRIAVLESVRAASAGEATSSEVGSAKATDDGSSPASAEPQAPVTRRRARRAPTAGPTEPRVALHDEIVAVIRERGPLTASEIADAIGERGRYLPPRSGKPLDGVTVSARVSNPTYRSRFTRREGRIGLAD